MMTSTLAAAPLVDVADEYTFPRGEWRGQWIGAALPHLAGIVAPLGATMAAGGFTRILMRRTFVLDELPDRAPARLTADSRYVLFVNGRELGRGPVRSQPRRLSYDQYDLSDDLVVGENVVSALISYYGDANAFWQPAAAVGRLGTDAVFVFEAEIGDTLVLSDETWRVHAPAAWTTFQKSGLDGVPIDSLDAALLPVGWTSPGFDDSPWDLAEIVRTDHIGGFARSSPPTDPYGALSRRTIGFLGGDIVAPVSVRAREVPRIEDIVDDRPSPLVLQAIASATLEAQAIVLPSTLSIDGSTWQHLDIDFGRIVAGFVQLEIDAPAGTIVDLQFRELPYVSPQDELATAPGGGGRYVSRGSDDLYEVVELHGLRYIHAVVRADVATAVVVRSITVREHTYQWEGDADFASNDAELNALYRAGRRTVQLNSFDAFTDCPTREQRSWVGDGVVHQMVHLTTNADWRLAKQYVWLGNAPRADGILPMSVAGEVEASGAFTIPDWSLHWIHGVHNVFRYSGDEQFILSVLPTVEGILRWYAAYVDDFGTISDVPEWNLVDWSSVFSTGRSSLLTALWARALREYAEMCTALGNGASARWALGLWHRAADGYEAFWDERRGTYVDHILKGVQQSPASQAAGATAIVSGLAPVVRWARIAEAISEPSTLVVRSWIGGADGGYDLEKMQEQARGIQRIDWDADTEVVRAEPFFSYVVHDALALAGREDRLIDGLRSWSAFLHNGYDTFGECWGWGTPVHGWSSTPTRDLIQYVLGVTPDEPGFGVARVSPRLAGLAWVRGTVPTPHGSITVSLDERELEVHSPVPCVVTLDGRAELRLAAGDHFLPLADASRSATSRTDRSTPHPWDRDT
jgi:alpha-L-rhamnosidase